MEEAPLGFLIVDTARLYRAWIDRMYEQAGLGLTAGEARTLAYVHLHPAFRQSALAEKMSVEPMTLVGFLDKLEVAGLVMREPDPTDRRAKIVTLTAEAAPYLERIFATAKAVRLSATEDFSEEEREQLRGMLLRVRANLAREHRCRDPR